MSDTDIVYDPTCLRACYAISGTAIASGPTHLRARYDAAMQCPACSGRGARVCVSRCARSNTFCAILDESVVVRAVNRFVFAVQALVQLLLFPFPPDS
eukprot:741097-Rhodomonas_salina.1